MEMGRKFETCGAPTLIPYIQPRNLLLPQTFKSTFSIFAEARPVTFNERLLWSLWRTLKIHFGLHRCVPTAWKRAHRMATFQRRHSLDLSLGPGLMEVIEVIEGVIGRLNTASCSLRVTRKDSYLGWWERNCPRWSDLEGMRKSNVSIFIRLIFCIVWTTTAFLILYTFVISLKLNMLSISGSYVGRCWRTQEFAGFGQPA